MNVAREKKNNTDPTFSARIGQGLIGMQQNVLDPDIWVNTYHSPLLRISNKTILISHLVILSSFLYPITPVLSLVFLITCKQLLQQGYSREIIVVYNDKAGQYYRDDVVGMLMCLSCSCGC